MKDTYPENPYSSEAEAMADHWYKMYIKVDEENRKLKEQVHKLSRIDYIGLNGNGGEHYEDQAV
jgi:hypothetical protein